MVEVIPASKSEMIRALVLKSWKPDLKIVGETQAEDVVYFKNSLDSFLAGKKIFYVGDSALGLRCLLARLSRESGEFEIHGTKRLLERPHDELIQALLHLGAEVVKQPKGFLLKSKGWKISAPLYISTHTSSQYATSLPLNAWNLSDPLTMKLDCLSSYLNLTLELLKQSGMNFVVSDNVIIIPPFQKILPSTLTVSPDMSTAFTMACWQAMSRGGNLFNFPANSLQPDFAFLDIFKKLGIHTQNNNGLEISKAEKLNSIEVDIAESPDLFPVLAALCAVADGASIILAGNKLKWKESDRLKMATVFLQMLSRKSELIQDGIIIYGKPFSEYEGRKTLSFNPNHDHRWVMAAQTARHIGFNIQIQNPEVIKKTAPELLAEVLQ